MSVGLGRRRPGRQRLLFAYLGNSQLPQRGVVAVQQHTVR